MSKAITNVPVKGSSAGKMASTTPRIAITRSDRGSPVATTAITITGLALDKTLDKPELAREITLVIGALNNQRRCVEYLHSNDRTSRVLKVNKHPCRAWSTHKRTSLGILQRYYDAGTKLLGESRTV